MGNPLDGARLRVVRAQQHLDAIKDFIARYCGSDPHTISVQKNDDVIETSFGIQDPDAFLSTIIGDCLTNCMASLDYTIWQLAEKFSSRTLFGPPAGKDRVHFPICDDPKNFETRKRMPLRIIRFPQMPSKWFMTFSLTEEGINRFGSSTFS
jgi:hypothetical protein